MAKSLSLRLLAWLTQGQFVLVQEEVLQEAINIKTEINPIHIMMETSRISL